MPDSSETGETGGERVTGRDKGTRVSILTLVARDSTSSRRTVMNNISIRVRQIQHGRVRGTIYIYT
jgi:hypothetical protein